MEFELLDINNQDKIKEMSTIASKIIREHYDPILGTKQNDYMLEKFQSERAIKDQLSNGYNYYFVKKDDKVLGFIAFYKRLDHLYLSKLYLYKNERGKGYSKEIINFVSLKAKELGLYAIELNVNKYNDAVMIYEKLGFTRIRSEKNDIGHNYFMDDYVYRLKLN